MFRVSLGTRTFSTVTARIWNARFVKFDVNVPLSKFEVKQYQLNNTYMLNYMLSQVDF